MRIFSIAVVAAFAAALQPAPGGEVAEFRQIAQNLAAAYLRGDRAFVDALLADDWTPPTIADASGPRRMGSQCSMVRGRR